VRKEKWRAPYQKGICPIKIERVPEEYLSWEGKKGLWREGILHWRKRIRKGRKAFLEKKPPKIFQKGRDKAEGEKTILQKAFSRPGAKKWQANRSLFSRNPFRGTGKSNRVPFS